jgi:hypothetical protein
MEQLQSQEEEPNRTTSNGLLLLPIAFAVVFVAAVLIYSILPDKKVKFCNLTLGYRVWWRWLCCGVCCNLYCFAGLTLEGKFIRSLEQHQQQLASLRSELDEQKDAREKAEKLFIKTCEELKSEAESLKVTIERLQCNHDSAVRIPDVRSAPTLSTLPSARLVHQHAALPLARPANPAQLAASYGSDPPHQSGGHVYISMAAENLAPPSAIDPRKLVDIFAAARFRRLLGGRLHRPGPMRP